METLPLVIGVLGLVATCLLHLAQRRVVRRSRRGRSGGRVPVSVLKPLCGLDAKLERNLESMFRQTGVPFEVLMGVASSDDPALPVARRVAARFPDVPSRIVVDARRIGINPKVDNLANLLRHARHEHLLISDSNVHVPDGYLTDMVATLMRPSVGLVTSPIRGVSPGSTDDRPRAWGAELEALQLNTFVMGGVGALTLWFGGVCAVGKSMLLRRSDLAAIGGLERLGLYLAEDQVSAEEIASLGLRVELATLPVDNVLGPIGATTFAKRHLRWARIRRWMCPAGYAGELLLQPLPFLLAYAAVARTSAAWVGFLAAWLAVALLDAVAERRLGVRRAAWTYPLLTLTKSAAIVALWPVPFWSRDVVWRGRPYRIGPRTRLLPTATAPEQVVAPTVPSALS